MASATGLLTTSSLLVRCLAFLTLPIVTRLVPPDAYGTTALVGTAISLLSSLALAGLDMSYARAYHAASLPNGIVVEGFVWRLAISGAFVVGVIGTAGWWLGAPRLGARREYALLVGIGVLLSVAQTMSQVKARLENRYRHMALAALAAGIVSTAVVIGIACWWRRDAFALLLAMLAGYLVVVATLGVPAPNIAFTRSSLSRPERRAVVGVGLAGVITAPMFWALSSLDRWFLSAMVGTAVTGIYSVGYNLAIFSTVVGAAISAVWLPEAARLFEADRGLARTVLGAMIEKLILCLAVIWLAVVAAGGDALRLLTAPAFHSAASVVPFIAGATFFNAVLQLANAGNLLAKTLHRTVLWWGIGAILCVLLNLMLIPRWGMVGAAVTQTCSFALMAIGVWVNAQRGFPLKVRSARLIGILACVVCAAIVMYPPWLRDPGASLLLKFPVGVAIAGFIGWATARDEMLWLLQKISWWKREPI